MTQMGGADARYLRSRPRPVRTGGDPIRLVDLFCGVGGMTLGVVEAARLAGLGVEVPLAVEMQPDIAKLYQQHFRPARDPKGDVRALFPARSSDETVLGVRRLAKEVGEVDILVAGPPCQGHSTLNNHTRGEDPKNALYDAAVRAVAALRPYAVIIENVPALERDARGTLARALRALERHGYKTDTGIVALDQIGVPQLRRRHVLLACRETQPSVAGAIDVGHTAAPRSVRWAIGDLEEAAGKGEFDRAAALSPTNERRVRHLFKNALYDLPNRQRPPCQQGDHKYKSMYGRLRWDEPAQTITTGFGSPGQGRYVHPGQPRTITPHEAARLQFFPDWFPLRGLPSRKLMADAIGNAVPPKLTFVLARHLLAHRLAREGSLALVAGA